MYSRAQASRMAMRPSKHTQDLNGCYTCRLRGKKCDVDILQNTEGKPCGTCIQLQIECMGYGRDYPAWIHDHLSLRRKITERLISTGHAIVVDRSMSGSSVHPTGTVIIEGILRLSPSDVSTPSFPSPNASKMQGDPTISGVTDLTDKIEIIDTENPNIGGFSEVLKALYSINQSVTEFVAVKKLIIANFKSNSAAEGALRLRKRLAREVDVWRNLDHPNIVRLLGVYTGKIDTFPGMVMPWYQHGCASHYLLARRVSILEKFTLLYEIACGLAYLHTRWPPIVHGDLKAQNVLIDDDGHAMLCDFGISRIVEEALEPSGTTTSGPVEGTLRWSAPEVVSGDELARFTPASDVWSFACTGYEIFTGKIPYYEHRGSGPVVVRIEKGVTPTWPADGHCDDESESIPDFVTHFISSRWKLHPEKRGKMGDIVDKMQYVLRLLNFQSDTRPQHPALNEWLAYWQMSGVVDLTNSITIINNQKSSVCGFSEIFKGFHSVDRDHDVTEVVAVRRLDITRLKSYLTKESALRLNKGIAREVHLWRGLSHPNIVRFLGVYVTRPATSPGMVMPWYQHGNASRYLLTRKFSIPEKFTLLYEIACGLAYLHTRRPPIIHGDLKAQNVVIDDGGHAMLCDFGLSRIIDGAVGLTAFITLGLAEGTHRWNAPENFSCKEPSRFIPTKASDVWSFGCVGYEILSQKIPYYQYPGRDQVVARIIMGETPTWPMDDHNDDAMRQNSEVNNRQEYTPTFVANFIGLRWKSDPQERGEMSDIANEMQTMFLNFVAI